MIKLFTMPSDIRGIIFDFSPTFLRFLTKTNNACIISLIFSYIERRLDISERLFLNNKYTHSKVITANRHDYGYHKKSCNASLPHPIICRFRVASNFQLRKTRSISWLGSRTKKIFCKTLEFWFT